MGGPSRWRPLFVLIAVFALGSVLVYFASVKVASIRPTSTRATPTTGGVISAGAGAGGREAGQRNYQSHCASCHGTGGKGDGWTAWLYRLKMRDLTDAGDMQALTDDYIFQIIKRGGASLGKPGMPSWGQELDDREIQDLVVHIRSLAAPPQEPQTTGSWR